MTSINIEKRLPPKTFTKKYHIAWLPPLILTGTSCATFTPSSSDKELWEGVAMVDNVCSSYFTNSEFSYYGYCESYQETVVELPIQYRYGFLGLYRYTEFSNYLLEISPLYVIFSYVNHYSYANILYNENYENISGFSYMFPYLKNRNTYRIEVPYNEEGMTCIESEELLNCSATIGVSQHITFKRSQRATIEEYLTSL